MSDMEEKKQKKQEKDWKQLLLKSGLPFEYEVKTCFARQGCLVYDDYSFIKSDENNIEKEFSFDIDASYWRGNRCVEFLIECKYKTEPTNWYFLPDDFSNEWEAKSTSFLHAIDYFSNEKFLYNNSPYDKVVEPLGPFCTKGTEIFSTEFLEKNIRSAINQVSYAFVEKVISALDSQLNVDLFKDTIFFNVPVIVTNAELRLINSNLTTGEIKDAKSIDEVSKKYNFLFFHNKIGEDLRRHNISRLKPYIFPNYVHEFTEENGGLLNNHEHFVNTISQNYCPEVILIMHHSETENNYEALFNHINFILQPSEILTKRTEQVTKEFQKTVLDINSKIRKKSQKNSIKKQAAKEISKDHWAFDIFLKMLEQVEIKFSAIEVIVVIPFGIEMRTTYHKGIKAFKAILQHEASQLEKNYEALLDLKALTDEIIILVDAISKKEFDDKKIIISKLLHFYDTNLAGLWERLEQKYEKVIVPLAFEPLKEKLIALEVAMSELRRV